MEAKQPPTNYIELLTGFINNGLAEIAEKKIKEWNLKIEIHNGVLVDMSESTDAYLNRFITVNPLMLELKSSVKKLSKVDAPVLIEGPTGTGKEIIARALHGNREGKFVAVNCAGLPETLIESLLFGHTAGAFTGAIKAQKGDFQTAANGTLFLDEIGELPIQVQAKLLRALQSKKIRRVGAQEEEDINCRFVCATNRKIRDMVVKDLFRIDLFARISAFELFLSGLSQRIEDVIPILSSMQGGSAFIEYLQKLYKESKGFEGGFDAWLRANLDLEFNVRSLQAYVERFNVLGTFKRERKI